MRGESPGLIQNFHSDPLLAVDDLQGVVRRVLNARTQTRALTAAIKGTRGPRAIHLNGLARASV